MNTHKKKHFASIVFLCVLGMGAVFAQSIQGKITVAPPTLQNGGTDDAWIPLFIQGQLITDFQNYSGLTVIDRQMAQQLAGEQSLLEQSAYASGSDVSIEYASLVSADYMVSVSILKKGASYALDCRVLNVKNSQSVGKAYSNPNISLAALNDGGILHTAAYELLQGLGVDEGRLAVLKEQGTSQTAEQQSAVIAQQSVARGIVAEQSGANIEALTYYIQARKNDRNLGEATSRMATMTSSVTSGNFGANAKNLMKLRNDWDKLLREAAKLIAANPPEFTLRYFTDIEAKEMTEQDYQRGTMSFTVSTPYLEQDMASGVENEKLANELLDTLHKIPESKNWGEKINGFPWSYGADIGGGNWLEKSAQFKSRNGSIWNIAGDSYPFTVSLLDANKKVIAQKNITFTVGYIKQYTSFAIISDNVDERESRSVLGRQIAALKQRDEYPYLYLITFSDIPVSDADTDKLYIAVENAGNEKLSIVPVQEGVLSEVKAAALLKSGNFEGIIKVAGNNLYNINEVLKTQEKKFALDLSEMYLPKMDKLRTRYWNHYTAPLLTSIILPKSTRIIEEDAFSGCSSLTSIVLPEGVTKIGKSLFSGCTSLKSVTLPDGIQEIGEYAFYKCTSLTDIKMPDGIQKIGEYAFGGCTSLASIKIPQGVTKLEYGLFDRCTSLKSVTLPDIIKEIGSHAFYSCSALASIVLPKHVAVISDSAFSDTAVTSVEIPEGTEELGGSAFRTDSLTSVILPSSIKNLTKSTFYSKSLRDVYYNGSKEQWNSQWYEYSQEWNWDSKAKKDVKMHFNSGPAEAKAAEEKRIAAERKAKAAVKYIYIADGKANIVAADLEGYTGLEIIIIPVSVTKIGANAFADSSALWRVSYLGSKKQWKAITVSKEGNDMLKRAKVVCNCRGSIPDSVTVIGGK